MQCLVEAYPESVEVKDSNGRTPLHMVSNFSAHKPTIRFLVERYPQGLKEQDKNGFTPFHHLCGQMKELSFIQPMVEACPDCVKIAGNYGLTPLHLACDRACHSHMTTMLYLAEMYPQALKMMETKDGRKPLDVAVATIASERVIAALAQTFPEILECTNNGDVSPLYSHCDNYSLVRCLPVYHWFVSVLHTFACSKEVILATDRFGLTALHILCCQTVRQQCLQVLIDNCPESAQARDNKGNTPLHRAIHTCFEPTTDNDRRKVACLIAAYPDGVFAMDINGMTPLMLACERNLNVSLIYRLFRLDPVRHFGLH